MKTHILKTGLILVPLTIAVPSHAQMATGEQSPSAASSAAPEGTAANSSDGDHALAHSDKSFAQKLAMNSTNEVALSQLADGRAASGDVKSFAAMMVGDHGKLNARLSDVAQRKGVDLQEAIEKGQKKGVSSLEKKNGAEFDKAYLKEMIKGHKSTADLLRNEIKDTKDSDLAAVANEALPIVLMHLQKAEELAREANGQ